MPRGRDTHTISITRRVKEELFLNCSDPDLLREIISRAEALAFMRVDERAAAIFELECDVRSAPCILWTPQHDQRHIRVQVRGNNASKPGEETIVHVARIVWTAFHVVSQQGDTGLLPHDEIHHTCGKNGADSTAYGACLNPMHMIKGNKSLRQTLLRTRRDLRTVKVHQIAI